MSHCIEIKIIKTEDAINCKIPHHRLHCGLSATSIDQSPSCIWLEVSTDYFGGVGEQSAEDSDRTVWETINLGLEHCFGICKTELDQFERVGLGKYRNNSDFLFLYEWEWHLCTNENILAVWRYGSRVYGTSKLDSDWDYVVISKSKFDPKDINIQVFTENEFNQSLNNCDILVLECYYSAPIFSNGYKKPKFNPVPSRMRTSISTITSNSWVKGKKKLTISGDYDLKAALKSVFHSLRILDYAIQILIEGTIVDWNSSNWILTELEKMSETSSRDQLWIDIDTKFRKLFNQRSTEFKKLAPKDLSENNKINKLKKILNEHNCYNEELLNSILTTLDL